MTIYYFKRLITIGVLVLRHIRQILHFTIVSVRARSNSLYFASENFENRDTAIIPNEVIKIWLITLYGIIKGYLSLYYFCAGFNT